MPDLSRPMATWMYMVHDNPFGSEIERFFANAARTVFRRWAQLGNVGSGFIAGTVLSTV